MSSLARMTTHIGHLPNQPTGPFEDPDSEGIRLWLGSDQLRAIAKFAGDRPVELEWRGSGYYMARVYDPNTREIADERLIFSLEP